MKQKSWRVQSWQNSLSGCSFNALPSHSRGTKQPGPLRNQHVPVRRAWSGPRQKLCSGILRAWSTIPGWAADTGQREALPPKLSRAARWTRQRWKPATIDMCSPMEPAKRQKGRKKCHWIVALRSPKLLKGKCIECENDKREKNLGLKFLERNNLFVNNIIKSPKEGDS